MLCDERKRSLAEVALEREEKGYFAGWVAEAKANALYGFRIGERSQTRFRPGFALSAAGAAGALAGRRSRRIFLVRSGWEGMSSEGQVIYEMHFGTFTPEGTYTAAAEQLGELAELGVTVLEVMPLADFPGRFGWGYDGVCLFAPTRLYGSPTIFAA